MFMLWVTSLARRRADTRVCPYPLNVTSPFGALANAPYLLPTTHYPPRRSQSSIATIYRALTDTFATRANIALSRIFVLINDYDLHWIKALRSKAYQNYSLFTIHYSRKISKGDFAHA